MRHAMAATLAIVIALGGLMGPACGGGGKSADAPASSPALATGTAPTTLATSPSSPEAPEILTITEYLDLFESYSQKYYLDVHLALAQKYGNKVKFDLKPVNAQSEDVKKKRSRLAAASAYCGQQQGKQQEFLTIYLRDKFMDLRDAVFKESAEQAKLNIPIYDACVQKGNWDDRLKENLLAASGLGIRSVPTVLIGDTAIRGLPDLGDYTKLVDRYLGLAPSGDRDLTVTMLYDETCRVCDDQSAAKMLVQLYQLSNAVVKRVAATSAQGQTLVNSTKTRFLPRLIFSKGIEDAKAYSGMKDNLDKIGNIYVFKGQMSGGVARWLDPPKLPERHVMGDPKAPLTAYEFLDFQCPACGGFYALKLPELKDKYVKTGLVKWVALQYPLAAHQYAYPAAVASECASDQGKFWEYHNMLFENQHSLTKNDLIQYASRVPGIKVEQFTTCLSRKDITERVEQDRRLGNDLGNPGTPTIFVGQYSLGNLDLAQIEKVFDAELARLKSKG
ncbi:MAG: DsbA family protein [bacterium]